MQPQRLNLEGWSNAPFPRDEIPILVDGAPLDLTASTARMQVRTTDGEAVIDISGHSANGIEFSDAAGGLVIPHIGWSDMMAAWTAAVLKAGADADLVYDMVFTDPDGLEQARLEGRFRIRAGVTVPGAYELANPPFGDDAGDFSELIPTSATPVVAMRTPDNALIVRCLTDTGIIEEYAVIDPAGYSGVDGGYQRVVHRSFVGGRVYSWLVQPEADGQRTIEEAAIRIHDQAYAYDSSLDSTGGAFGGFGHGYWLNTPAANQITMTDGPGGNLQAFVDWPAGTIIRGSALVISCPFRQVFYGTSTEAVSIILDSIFDTSGMATQATIQAIRSDVRWQDSYCPMFAATASADVTHAKLAGFTAIPLVGDGVQKGNWHSTTAAPVMQFYNASEPTVICEATVVYGPPMRENGADLNWDLNLGGRVHISDVAGSMGNPAYAKFRVFLNSSEPTLPRSSWAMDPADVFTALVRRRAVIRESGPL